MKNVIPSDDLADTSKVNFDLIEALSTLEDLALIRPQNPPEGISGFLFDIIGDESISLESDITDNFLENNTAIQDQIALRPEIITVHGLVAELTNANKPKPVFNPPADPLPLNTPMVPVKSPGSLAKQLKSVALGLVGKVAGQVAGQVIGRLGNGLTLNGVRGIIKGAVRGVARNAVQSVKASVLGAVRKKLSGVAQGAISTLMQATSIQSLSVKGILLPLVTQNAVNILKKVIPNGVKNIIGSILKPGVPSAQKMLAAAPPLPAAASVNNLNEAYTAAQPTPPKLTRQSSAFLYFYALWKARQLVTVETAWGTWENMAILSCKMDQSEDTRDQTEFTIVFKKIRFAQEVSVTLGQLAGRAIAQTGVSSPQQNGTAGQQEVPPQQKESWLFQVTH